MPEFHEETPLERLNRLAQDLSVEATRADVTGEQRVYVTHEWTDEMLEANRLLQVEGRKPVWTWAATPWPTKGLIVAFCVAASVALLGAGWIAAAWCWSHAQDILH